MKIKFEFDKFGNVIVKNDVDDRELYLQDSQDIKEFVEKLGIDYHHGLGWESREGEWFNDPGYFDQAEQEAKVCLNLGELCRAYSEGFRFAFGNELVFRRPVKGLQLSTLASKIVNHQALRPASLPIRKLRVVADCLNEYLKTEIDPSSKKKEITNQ